MKSREFISKLRIGNKQGITEVTVPDKFRRMNGMVVGKEYLFYVKEVTEE